MASPPTSPYRRPQTPIPPFSPPSLPLTRSAMLASSTPSRSVLLKHAQHHPTSFLLHEGSPHPSPTDVGKTRTGSRLMQVVASAKQEVEGGGQERGEGSGFDTLKSDFEFFFDAGETTRGQGTPPLDPDNSPSTVHWDSPEMPETELSATAATHLRSDGCQEAAPPDKPENGLGFDFHLTLEPASPPVVAAEDPSHALPIYTLTVPPPDNSRRSSTTSDRPLSGYSSGFDGDVSASDQSGDDDEGGKYADAIEPMSSSPIEMGVRSGIPLFVARQRKRTEGDVTDEAMSSSATDGGTVLSGGDEGAGLGTSTRRHRIARLKRMEREDYRGKGYPYESDRPDYRAECLDVSSEVTTAAGSFSEFSDQDESDIADVTATDLLVMHPVY